MKNKNASEKLIAAQNNIKLVETENKTTEEKLEPTTDINIS